MTRSRRDSPTATEWLSRRWDIVAVLLITAATWLAGTPLMAADTNLVVNDKEIRFGLPATMTDPLPLHLSPGLKTEYTADRAGDCKIEKMVVEEGLKYPTLWGGIHAGSTVGETVLTAVPEPHAVEVENRAYLTTWLSKDWAGVNLSVTHTHFIERIQEQVAYGLSKAFSPFTMKNLSFSVGEYLLNDVGTRYWYRSTNLSLDWGWRLWGLSLFAEQQGDTSVQERSAGIQVKSRF